MVVYLSIQGCMCMRETGVVFKCVCTNMFRFPFYSDQDYCKQQFRFCSLSLFFEAVVAGSGYIFAVNRKTNKLFRKNTILVYQYHYYISTATPPTCSVAHASTAAAPAPPTAPHDGSSYSLPQHTACQVSVLQRPRLLKCLQATISITLVFFFFECTACLYTCATSVCGRGLV